MKTKFFLPLFLLLPFFSAAQIEKGSFMLEGGINLSDGWYYDSSYFVEGFGISFGTHDYIGKDYITGGEKVNFSNKGFGFSLAPRVGFALFKNFLIGADYRYKRKLIKSTPYSSDGYANDKALGYGFFSRKYFGHRKLTPFIEAEFGFWSGKHSEIDYSPGGARYLSVDKSDLNYYGGSLGGSYSVSKRFKINLLAKLRHTKELLKNSYVSKTLNFDTALILSFSYFLNKKPNPKPE